MNLLYIIHSMNKKITIVLTLTFITILLIVSILYIIKNNSSDFNTVEVINEKWIWINSVDNSIEVKEININKEDLRVQNDVIRK